MPDNISSCNQNLIQAKLQEILTNKEHLEFHDSKLIDAIKLIDEVKPKNFYSQQVLSVLQWFAKFYTNCENDEKEFLCQHFDKIRNSAYPRDVLDTLCLLYYYKLHKSQQQLDKEFSNLKAALENSKPIVQNSISAEDRTFLDEIKPSFSLEAYTELILRNNHCKKIANCLAVLNNYKLLIKENIVLLFKQPYPDFELLEKCLVELNNRLLIKDDRSFLYQNNSNKSVIVANLQKIIQNFSEHSPIIKVFSLLEQFSILTVNNIHTLLNNKEIGVLFVAKLLIIKKNEQALTEQIIETILSTLLISLEEKHSQQLTKLIFLLNERTCFLTETNILMLLKQPIETLSNLENILLESNVNSSLELLNKDEFFTKENLVIILKQFNLEESIYQVLNNLDDNLSEKNCNQLKTALLSSENQKKQKLLSLITLLNTKSGSQKNPSVSVSPNSFTPSFHHEKLSRSSNFKRRWKPSINLIKRIKKLIRKWQAFIETHKRKKVIYRQYQIYIKQLSERTDIQALARILGDIGILYRKATPLPKENPSIDQLIEKFALTNPLQAKVLRWLNSSYYRYGKDDEKKFIQQHLNKILNFTNPEKALYAIFMLYYCGFHTEKQYNDILVSNQANDFITLFLEKLHLLNGKSVELLKKEVQTDLDRLNTPPAIRADKVEIKISAVTKKPPLEPIKRGEPFSVSSPTKHGAFFWTPKTVDRIRVDFINRALRNRGV